MRRLAAAAIDGVGLVELQHRPRRVGALFPTRLTDLAEQFGV